MEMEDVYLVIARNYAVAAVAGDVMNFDPLHLIGSIFD